MEQAFKYCPHCSYRLRPEFLQPPRAEPDRSGLGERLVAFGGILLFGSLLLLVVLAGIQLFVEADPTADAIRRVVRRDGGTVPLDASAFREVESGVALFGRYRRTPAEQPENVGKTAADVRESLDAALVLLHPDRWTDVFDLRRIRERPAIALLYDLEAAREETDAIEAEELAARIEALRIDTAAVLIDEANTLAEQLRPKEPGFEKPRAYVVDDAFRLGAHEVTNDQWFAFLEARARRAPGTPLPYPYPNDWTRRLERADVTRIYEPRTGDHPVRYVTFAAALEFCAWLWETEFGADPDFVVDLPTPEEYVLAARRDRASLNYPWGEVFDPDASHHLEGDGPVDVDAGGRYFGFHHLVGNVAEWVHPRGAIGWSFRLNPARIDRTPFDYGEIREGETRADDIGLRVLVRRAPHLPEFARVTAGRVRHVARENPMLPPLDLFSESEEEEARLPPVRFTADTDEVAGDFEIARTAITNRQYLAFLADLARTLHAGAIAPYLPASFTRAHPLPGWSPFAGPYGPAAKIPRIYEAGAESHPVLEITPDQAEAYAQWLATIVRSPVRLPTIAQYLRAGRADGAAPYPWGDNVHDPELITDEDGRAVSLLGRLAPTDRAVVGLAGNVLELVRDPADERLLLAGGCFGFPAEACTLDSFLDASWREVYDRGTRRFVQLATYTGFRVVRDEP